MAKKEDEKLDDELVDKFVTDLLKKAYDGLSFDIGSLEDDKKINVPVEYYSSEHLH